ncbi:MULTISPECIES: hypothetical protein [Tenacibaculum]|uniref:Bacteriophage CI repressor helix-turn-helix domain-containing protein n=3 Tax=Tenacibaculum TaxID=104267 RepID=A0AAE9MRB7_9FLAO|nr:MULTISPECIES: hypothetical protein [Tenacibaculum]GFD94812.1 hypothetical protein KUL154_35450 [Alteromonas sp. KUL154]GFE00870.1 hypothetical protein KUL156_34620 [Alteromonas sp. KUL156]KAF9659746.1 hypothetical protein HBA12_05775 [Tenacibaculum mesophilum]MCG7502001.1 hypothetical protein [Tenacibaculum sp. Mcav3-52]MCO7185291.1 hypothetical protein [Tenacibaculum sp. XPcli2-G]
MSDFVDETYKRVEEVINYKRLNIRSFEEIIDVSNNSIGTAIRRKSSFKSNVLNKILHSFPEINPTWLLTGKEEMLLSVTNEPSSIYKIKDINSRLKDSLLYLLQEDKEVKEAIASQVAKVLKE